MLRLVKSMPLNTNVVIPARKRRVSRAKDVKPCSLDSGNPCRSDGLVYKCMG
jgi:hypothetical protein